MTNKENIYAGIIGGIVGDALGVPYEFSTREEMIENPAATMTGYGTYNQPPGTWSDDSSLTLATLDSLSNGVNYEDMMEKFCQWIKYAEYTQHGDVFDYGKTTYYSIRNYWFHHLNPLKCGMKRDIYNGNGSLMRILPVSLYCYYNKLNVNDQIRLIDNISSLTHAHKICKASCNIYNFIIQETLRSKDFKKEDDLKKIISKGLDNSRKYYDNNEYECFKRLYSSLLTEESYVMSMGYVVDSLEVALYCCYHSNNYRDAVLNSINTGGDTDTNAMITGGLVGIYYGYSSIPQDWINSIPKLDYAKSLCDKFTESLND